MFNVLLIVLPMAALLLSLGYAVRSVKKGQKTGRAVTRQIATFLLVCVVTLAAPLAVSATSGDAAAAGGNGGGPWWARLLTAGACWPRRWRSAWPASAAALRLRRQPRRPSALRLRTRRLR